MNTAKLLRVLTASAVLFLAGTPANAGLILTLTAGSGQSVTITDGGVGDLDHRAGSVTWFGTLGSWIFNFTAGLSNSPALTGPAILNLVSFNATSRNGGTLTISLTDTFQTTSPLGPNMTATSSVTGSTSGVASFNSLFNTANLANLGSFSGAFNGTSTSTVDTTGGFSLTHIATINHAGSGITGFSMVTSVPEPGVLGLLGLGLASFGLLYRHRRRKE